MLDLFCAVWIFGFFGMVGGARGGLGFAHYHILLDIEEVCYNILHMTLDFRGGMERERERGRNNPPRFFQFLSFKINA